MKGIGLQTYLLALITMLLFDVGIYAQAQDKPNIIFILTDDQSYGMMGCTGNPYVKTPNIDKLADKGVLFTNAHITSAICTPSRISILLSQYERKHGVNFNSGTSVSEEAWSKSYPVVLRKHNYFTGWIGKNHAPIGDGGYGSGLMEKSFDYWYAGHGHLSFYPKDRHEIFNDAKSDTQCEILTEGVRDFLGSNEDRLQGAIRFLQDRPKEQPFMLSINLNLPHGASTSTMKLKDSDDEIYKSLYRDLDIPLPKNYIAKAAIKNPKLPADLLLANERQQGYSYVDTPEDTKERIIRQWQAMTGIDRLVGNLMKELDQLNLQKNTIIIFSSDHGLFMGEHGLGGKALCYEKNTKVPLIIFDPRAKKNRQGIENDALVQSIDIAPTMLASAGIPVPQEYQGKDLAPLLTEDTSELRSYVFTENLWSTQFGNPRCEAVQDKEWKYIRYYQNNNFPASKKIKTAELLGMNISKMLYTVHDIDMARYREFIEAPLQGEMPVYEELYHLKTDPDELNNLIDDPANKSIVEELRKVWKKELFIARGNEEPKVLRYTNDSHPEGIH